MSVVPPPPPPLSRGPFPSPGLSFFFRVWPRSSFPNPHRRLLPSFAWVMEGRPPPVFCFPGALALFLTNMDGFFPLFFSGASAPPPFFFLFFIPFLRRSFAFSFLPRRPVVPFLGRGFHPFLIVLLVTAPVVAPCAEHPNRCASFFFCASCFLWRNFP